MTERERESALAVRVNDGQIEELDAVALACQQIAVQPALGFRKTFQLAAAMARLNELISPEVMRDVMALQGSALGYRTDRDGKGGYKLAVVKEVAIEATARGLRMVGNEVNIIAGRFYAAQAGLRRLVLEWPGLTDLRIRISPPRSTDEGFALVDAVASWKLDGRPCQLERRGDFALAVRVNDRSIVDAVIGKAKRKLLAAILDELQGGHTWSDDGAAVDQVVDQVVESAADPPAAASADPPAAPIDRYLAGVEAADNIHLCNQWAQACAHDPDLSAEQKAVVHAACDRRRAEIRAGRGEGSNE